MQTFIGKPEVIQSHHASWEKPHSDLTYSPKQSAMPVCWQNRPQDDSSVNWGGIILRGGVRIKYYTDRLILHSKNWSMFLSCQNNITITPNKTKMYSWIPMPDPFSVPRYTPNVLLNIYAVSLNAFSVMLWLIEWFSISRYFPHRLGIYIFFYPWVLV